MVQTSGLAEYASGYQTDLEVSRQSDLRRICKHVATASRAVLFAVFRRDYGRVGYRVGYRVSYDVVMPRSHRLSIDTRFRSVAGTGATKPPAAASASALRSSASSCL